MMANTAADSRDTSSSCVCDCVMRQVMLDYEGLSQTVFVITGSALGMDVSLDYRTIPFGIVVPRNSVERSVTLRNAGDIGTRYEHPVSVCLAVMFNQCQCFLQCFDTVNDWLRERQPARNKSCTAITNLLWTPLGTRRKLEKKKNKLVKQKLKVLVN